MSVFLCCLLSTMCFHMFQSRATPRRTTPMSLFHACVPLNPRRQGPHSIMASLVSSITARSSTSSSSNTKLTIASSTATLTFYVDYTRLAASQICQQAGRQDIPLLHSNIWDLPGLQSASALFRLCICLVPPSRSHACTGPRALRA